MTFTAKLGGWKPDHKMPGAASIVDLKFEDNVDKIEASGATAPNQGQEVNDVLDLRHWCSPVEDQRYASSCVGNGTVGALEFLQLRNGQPLVDLSRLFVYYNARLMTQDQDKDNGTFIRLAFGTLSALGTCTEAKWPYDLTKLFVRPSWGSYRDAYPNKVDSYYSISAAGQIRIDYIKRALRAQHVVVFGMTVDQDYMNYSGGVVAMPKQVRPNPGGHCQVIVGYDNNKQCWIVRNSWGTGWGEGGYAFVPFDYLDASSADDFWVPYLPGTSADNG